MADRFGLGKLRDGVKKRAEELKHGENADVKSYDEPRPSESEGPYKPYTFQQSDFDRTEPDHDAMHTYWRQFETTPFVRKSITSFARQVMEPGYYIEVRDGSSIDRDTLQDLDHWLTKSSIVEGEFGQDFRQLAKKAIIQQEVRGTAFIEKAPSNNNVDEIAGLKLINAETMEAVTRPGQSILLQPEDVDEYEDAPAAESGGAAAWLQDLGETETFFGTPVSADDRRDHDENDDFKIGFREDEIVKLARDADAGEIFGTSRMEAVSDRIKGLRQKLSDNDEAIASKAYPLWLFMFGSEDNPWESDDIDEFMRSHEMENFHPGMKQGVRGDVSVDTVSGEVAEISEALNFDIEWIMSVMPIPKFALGAFSEGGVGQFGGIAQQQEMQRQIKDARREIEEKFTPIIREVAMQNGVSEEEAENIQLKIGTVGEPETEVPRRENIIRYVPEDQREGTGSNPNMTNEGVPDDMIDSDGLPEGVQKPRSDKVDPPEETPEEAGAQSWHTDSSMAELSLSDDSGLSDAIYETMVETRDETLSQVSSEYENAPSFAATKFEKIANSVLRSKLTRGNFGDSVRPYVDELVEEDNSFTRSNNVRFFVQDIENATEDALEEMLRLMRLQVRRGANNGEEMDDIMARVERKYNDAKLRERAELIAHMELRNAEETMKLERFERDNEVIGVRVVNDDPSTPLTESLAGAEAYFSEGPIQEQLMSKTREEFLHKGFDPLPPAPPYHFNDTTTLEPIYE